MTAVSPKRSAALALGILWILSYASARFGLKFLDLGTAGKLLLVAVPVIIFAFAIEAVIGAIRTLDELDRRVHLEALAIAFPLSMLLLMALGLLELVIDLPPEDWSYRHIWPFLTIFYFVGLAFARKRYE
jgi:hypothetical protein